MSNVKIKQELHEYIERGDTAFIEAIQRMVKTYFAQSNNDKLISESEEDIQAGHIHSQSEVNKIIESWVE